MTAYLGFEVVTVSPNARDPQEDGFHRSMAALDPSLGARASRARDAAPAMARAFQWTCQNRADIVALKAFLAAHRGLAVPFWMPSRRMDLLLNQAVGASDPAIVIQGMGYTRHLFPSHARRHLAILSGSTWVLRSVTDASETGPTEVLTLSASLGVAVPVGALVSQLLLCRMGSDDVEISYLTDSVAEARIPYVEIPQEAP